MRTIAVRLDHTTTLKIVMDAERGELPEHLSAISAGDEVQIIQLYDFESEQKVILLEMFK